MLEDEVYDFIVVGGGPVGLHAGLKAALLNHTALVLDKGRKWCRVWFVPRIDNIPGFPDGISGADLVNSGREALKKHEKKVQLKDFLEVNSIEKGKTYKVKALNSRTNRTEVFESKAIILATGISDNQPLIDGSIQHILPYAGKGLVHYCMFCDGHRMAGQDVAVFGHTKFAVNTAMDLDWFEAKSVTILTNGKEMFEGEDLNEIEKKDILDKLEDHEVEAVTTEIASLFGLDDNVLGLKFTDGSERTFETGMSALGVYRINNELAALLGGKLDEEGYVIIDSDSRVLDNSGNPIEGLYAVGDVTDDWNQIPIGFGNAERAVIHAYSYLI
ncbi:MAG: NAD(P)/FAD-dependent oxidoreductase [Thermoplasmata archaeon]|nr:NAD(P)/FAD-dependent oxidoreductase [Thermoplasmata archaeon]